MHTIIVFVIGFVAGAVTATLILFNNPPSWFINRVDTWKQKLKDKVNKL
jgi:hypothetical protein